MMCGIPLGTQEWSNCFDRTGMAKDMSSRSSCSWHSIFTQRNSDSPVHRLCLTHRSICQMKGCMMCGIPLGFQEWSTCFDRTSVAEVMSSSRWCSPDNSIFNQRNSDSPAHQLLQLLNAQEHLSNERMHDVRDSFGFSGVVYLLLMAKVSMTSHFHIRNTSGSPAPPPIAYYRIAFVKWKDNERNSFGISGVVYLLGLGEHGECYGDVVSKLFS